MLQSYISPGTSRRNRNHTDDEAPTIGQNVEERDVVDVELVRAVRRTTAMGMQNRTRRDYRQRIFRFVDFLRRNKRIYCQAGGIRLLPAEECQRETRYMFGQDTDLVYRGMDIEIILQCFAAYSFLDDGGKKCYQDQRKYRDAIIWGAKTANERLPASFFERTSEYLIAYKKQYAVAKREGKTGDDQATDPIPLPVYKFLLRRSIQENNMFAWTWTLLQWNCMARSASIDCLGLHNIRLGPDSIIIKYDESKADKAGERLSEKNIFANPKEWKMCTWLSLGKFLFVFYFIEQCLNSSCFFSFPLADAQQRQPRCLFFLLS